ncbi:hypothetical protein PQJ75_30995, partial [Rhodoplanes sp. TEM]|nr:hypothetical protein [Rhodoplanes sp. TEM]
MFRTLSSNVLLKSVIVVMATTIVLVLGSGAWTAWQTLATANRVSDVAGAAGHLFRAMSTLRMSRAITIRTLNIDAPANADQTKMVAGFTATITPALQASLKALPGIDFPGRAERVATLAQLLQTQMRLDGEIAANLAKPKPQRRAGLAREAEANMTGLLDVINAINPAIAKVVMNNEAFVDQMMQLKDAAWLVRDNGGAASATVASALAFKQRVPEGTVQTLWNQIGRLDAGWQIIESARSGLAPASPLHAAMDKAKALFFAPDYVATRRQTIAALAAGQPVDIKSSDWSVDSIPRLQSLVALAETALDAATDHAQAKVAE